MKSMRFKILLLSSFILTTIFGTSLALNVFASGEGTTNTTDVSNLLVQPSSPTIPSLVVGSDTTAPIIGTTDDNSVQTSSSILMHLSPTNPNPGDSVSVNITSYAENLNSSKVDWFVNNKLISSGIGETTITVQAPAAGVLMTIIAKITLVSHAQTQVGTTIIPSKTELLWEAIGSYTPPFYKGKTLTTPGNWIKVVAMPEIKTPNGMAKPNNLIYDWEEDFTNSPNGSGFAKNYFLYKNDFLDSSNNIGVTVSSTDQKYTSQNRIQITPGSPELLFYKEDPNLGVLWDNALQSPHKINGEETIIAAPYFISPDDFQASDLNFKWSINDIPTTILSKLKNVMPLKSEAGSSGSSEINLQVNSNTNFLENVSGNILIQF